MIHKLMCVVLRKAAIDHRLIGIYLGALLDFFQDCGLQDITLDHWNHASPNLALFAVEDPEYRSFVRVAARIAYSYCIGLAARLIDSQSALLVHIADGTANVGFV